MQQKLRVLHKTFFTGKIADVQFKAVVKKKEGQQTFPVDIEVK